MFKVFITTIALASTSLFVGCSEAQKEVSVETKPAAPQIPANAVTKTIEVKKMDCGGCAAKVKKCLADVEGMEFVKANPKEHTVLIAVTDETKFKMENAITAIKDATGWEATEK